LLPTPRMVQSRWTAACGAARFAAAARQTSDM
jgi:hypothetical protein